MHRSIPVTGPPPPARHVRENPDGRQQRIAGLGMGGSVDPALTRQAPTMCGRSLHATTAAVANMESSATLSLFYFSDCILTAIPNTL